MAARAVILIEALGDHVGNDASTNWIIGFNALDRWTLAEVSCYVLLDSPLPHTKTKRVNDAGRGIAGLSVGKYFITVERPISHRCRHYDTTR